MTQSLSSTPSGAAGKIVFQEAIAGRASPIGRVTLKVAACGRQWLTARGAAKVGLQLRKRVTSIVSGGDGDANLAAGHVGDLCMNDAVGRTWPLGTLNKAFRGEI